MLGWFLFNNSSEENVDGDETKEAGERFSEDLGLPLEQTSVGRSMARQGTLTPKSDKLSPAATSAILTQAAFRGYRLRERLRRLPAREAERTIRGLQRNSHGFWRLGLFLTFFGLYFSMVFTTTNVAFQRSVEQGLRNHLAKVKYGPELDRTRHDVASLADVHQWMQALYLRTYMGTQLEHPCTACIVRPSDDVCDSCDYALYDAQKPEDDDDSFFYPFVRDGSSSGSGSTSTSPESSSSATADVSAFLNRSRRVLTTTSSGDYELSQDCQACLIGRYCEGAYADNCAAYLEATFGVDDTTGDAAWSSPSSASNGTASSAFLNSTLLSNIELEPWGDVSSSSDHLSIENATQCETYTLDVGFTESLARFFRGLGIEYNGLGYIANRNRIIGGMLVTFSRRERTGADGCESSLDYYDVCLKDDENKDDIDPEDYVWSQFRPDLVLTYNSDAGGYPILIDTGGFNVGLNFGYCTLLVMDDIGIIPADEVDKVSVQLVTYNGNEPSAYGSVYVEFNFDDGGNVESTELVQVYVLTGNITGPDEIGQWAAGVLFVLIAVGMARYDLVKWCRVRRTKAKRNRCHCCCGVVFFSLVFINILMWLAWALLGSQVEFGSYVLNSNDQADVLSSLTGEILLLYEVGLFADAYYFVFLLTTMAGLYRWIFQMLAFHKRMSIVTDTLSRASTHLDHFLFVMLLVVLAFTNLTWMLVGSSTWEFSTLDMAWRSVVRISLGEAENFYPQILEAQPTVGPVVVVLYQVLGVVLLLNVVIAVLLEAYRGVRLGMRGEDTIFQSLTAFIGMTLCSCRARLLWALAYVRWRLYEKGKRLAPSRPSLKVTFLGSTGVYGVDGRPVLMVRRPTKAGSLFRERQLSYNCPRYITVSEMRALIKATPVPSFVADRLVRKIVHEWVFYSDERPTGDLYGLSSGSSGTSTESGSSMPMLRRSGVDVAIDSSSFVSR